MFEIAKAIEQDLSQLSPDNRKTHWKEIQIDVLTLLEALTAMQPEQGKADFSLFQSLAFRAYVSAATR